MKYLNLSSFEQHLNTKTKMASLYGVISACRFERKKMVAAILKSCGENVDFLQDLSDDSGLERVLEHLQTRSLFGGMSVAFFDQVDKLLKKEKQKLMEYLKQPVSGSILILGSPTSRGIQDLYTAGKKEMIACDLSAEKPWEKRKRLEKMLVEHALQLGKILKSDAALLLIDQVGSDLSTLEQELMKLSLFCAGRTEISRKDIETIGANRTVGVTWEWIDELLFSDEVYSRPQVDESQLFPLIGQIRYNLQIALEIGACVQARMSSADIHSGFPQLQRNKLEKIIHAIEKKTFYHFDKALHLLFEMEFSAKNSSLNPSLLLDLWIHKKNQHSFSYPTS